VLKVAVFALLATFEHSVAATTRPPTANPTTVAAGKAPFHAAPARAPVPTEVVSVVAVFIEVQHTVTARCRLVAAKWVAAVFGPAVAVFAVFAGVEHSVAAQFITCSSRTTVGCARFPNRADPPWPTSPASPPRSAAPPPEALPLGLPADAAPLGPPPEPSSFRFPLVPVGSVWSLDALRRQER
jgi:hypothetical protein